MSVSAERLLDILSGYREREHDPTLSLSVISRALLDEDGDRQLLARWTNPGVRPNWRIPLKRVEDVALFLGASKFETDMLMLARLEELADDGDRTGVVKAVSWAFDLAERAQSDEERFLLKLLETARDGWAPEVNLMLIPVAARDALVAEVQKLLHKAGDELTAAAHEAPLTKRQQATVRAQREALLASLQTQKAASSKRPAHTRRLRGEPRPSKLRKKYDSLRAIRAVIKAAQANARLVVDSGKK